MSKKAKKLVLLDAHAIIHRAYHALPDFSTASGDPTGALYGVCTMLFKIVEELKPDAIVACYDRAEKTFRHEVYDDYKAGRSKADDELVFQLEESRSIFHAFNIPVIDYPGFEADDILGTIVEQTKNLKDLEVIIASGDMDTLQLVDGERVKVYTLKKGIKDTIMYNEEAVRERYGFSPVELVDYKALRGDPSDNIIGVPGIGDKTATALVVGFGSVEEVLRLAKEDPEKLKKEGIKERIVNLLVEHEEEALFSKTLATIRRDAPVDYTIPEDHWKDRVNLEGAKELFERFEFRSLVSRMYSVFGVEVEEKEDKKIEASGESFEKAKIALWLLDSEKTNPTAEDILNYTKKKDIEESLLKLEEDLKKEDLWYVYSEIEVPIIGVIKSMQENGVGVDVPYLKEFSKKLHKELSSFEKKIFEMAGSEFNVNSPKQLGEILFEKIGLPTKGIKKTKSGGYSTNASMLEKLEEEHEIIPLILRYRELQKLLSTYIDTLPTYVGKDGRLHAEFVQTGTTTGRFSSNNPNLQNIPVRSGYGHDIRRAFVAPKDTYFVACDYSQIELRVAAILSQDERLLKIFQEGKDVHAGVASFVFGVDEKDVTKDQRRKAKVINFGIIYGMGVVALKKSLGGTKKEAEEFLGNYFKQFPAVKSYLDGQKDFAREKGYTVTLFGRKRFFPSIRSKIPFIRAMAERMAINAPIQGTATADIIKLAMKEVDDYLEKESLKDKVKMIMQVHDELIFEIDKKTLPEVIDKIKEKMEGVLPTALLEGRESVPILVDIAYGENWADLKNYS
jgi:DNA polymerase-1